jgi:hypothetical protein
MGKRRLRLSLEIERVLSALGFCCGSDAEEGAFESRILGGGCVCVLREETRTRRFLFLVRVLVPRAWRSPGAAVPAIPTTSAHEHPEPLTRS